MVAQRQRQLAFPLRWWSWGPFWRYERPQKGRTREFFQWNIDMIGAESPEADAELAAIAASFLQRVGLSAGQVRLLVNNRRLMDAELVALGVPQENHAAVFRVIDRRDKMHPPEWEQYALSAGLSPAQLEGLLALLDDQDLWQRSEEMRRFFAAVEALGMQAYVRYAPHIIRGLDYYTGTVFEAWDQDGEFRAILGGGRYDNLVSDVGGEPLRSVGFAMGDLVMSLVLAKFGCLPENLSASPAAVLVTVFDEAMLPSALRLSRELREAGINVAVYPEVAKLGRQFKYADRAGIPLAVVYGPDEQAQGAVAIKDLRSGEQRTVPQHGLAEAVRSMLGRNG
jgi:histidyl-tRNA synthetase